MKRIQSVIKHDGRENIINVLHDFLNTENMDYVIV